jgi:predicted TPR repeat methyltransferase
VEETLDIYANWAASYDDDLAEAGYETPHRIAAALAKLTTPDARILDFGCGTGLSGQALQIAGFKNLDGIDISAPMLNKAQIRNIYHMLWQGQPGEMTGVTAGQYDVIVAAGVVSLGAAPPETLSMIIDYLAPEGLIGLSFNDPTLDHGSYEAVLGQEISLDRVSTLSCTHGPHLRQQEMGSNVIVLQRL